MHTALCVSSIVHLQSRCPALVASREWVSHDSVSQLLTLESLAQPLIPDRHRHMLHAMSTSRVCLFQTSSCFASQTLTSPSSHLVTSPSLSFVLSPFASLSVVHYAFQSLSLSSCMPSVCSCRRPPLHPTFAYSSPFKLTHRLHCCFSLQAPCVPRVSADASELHALHAIALAALVFTRPFALVSLLLLPFRRRHLPPPSTLSADLDVHLRNSQPDAGSRDPGDQLRHQLARSSRRHL